MDNCYGRKKQLEIERRNRDFVSISEKKAEEEKRRREYRHDWRIAVFSVIGGAVSGGIVSLIFWLVEHYC